jgi:hypothetical protein
VSCQDKSFFVFFLFKNYYLPTLKIFDFCYAKKERKKKNNNIMFSTCYVMVCIKSEPLLVFVGFLFSHNYVYYFLVRFFTFKNKHKGMNKDDE